MIIFVPESVDWSGTDGNFAVYNGEYHNHGDGDEYPYEMAGEIEVTWITKTVEHFCDDNRNRAYYFRAATPLEVAQLKCEGLL